MTEHDKLILIAVPFGESSAARLGIIRDTLREYNFAKSTCQNKLKELYNAGLVQRRERRDNSGIYYEYWRERVVPAVERAA